MRGCRDASAALRSRQDNKKGARAFSTCNQLSSSISYRTHQSVSTNQQRRSDVFGRRREAMRYQRLVRSALTAVAIWLSIGCLAPAANALIVCTGTQSLADPGNGDSCSTTADGGSITQAQASVNSSATASAKGASTANSQASDFGMAHAKATNSGNAQASAADHSSVSSAASNGSASESTATDFSTADTCADGGSKAQADSDSSSTATSTATGSSIAESQATGGSSAQALASQNSSAQVVAENGGNAVAQAINNSTASAENGANSTFVGVYATNGSTASGSNTAPPVCLPASGGIAVVVSPAGNCGPVDQSPFAGGAATPEIDPNVAGEGLAIVVIGFLLLGERRRARS